MHTKTINVMQRKEGERKESVPSCHLRGLVLLPRHTSKLHQDLLTCVFCDLHDVVAAGTAEDCNEEIPHQLEVCIHEVSLGVQRNCRAIAVLLVVVGTYCVDDEGVYSCVVAVAHLWTLEEVVPPLNLFPALLTSLQTTYVIVNSVEKEKKV